MKKPDSPFSIRLDPQLKVELEKIAKKEDRSLAYLINIAVGEWLASQKKKR